MDRELKFMLTRYATLGNVGIALTHLNEMLNHEDRICYDGDKRVSKFTAGELRYIYAVYLTSDRLIMIMEDMNDMFYLIKNRVIGKRPEVTSDSSPDVSPVIHSEVIRSSSMKFVVSKLSGSERKLLRIPKGIKNHDRSVLKLPMGFDFGRGRDVEVMKEMVRDSHLNLGGCQLMTSAMLGELLPVCDCSLVSKLTLDRNIRVGSFEWLQLLPKLSELTISHCPQITNKTIAQICKSMPNLRHLTLTECVNIDLSIFIHVIRHERMESLWVEDCKFSCQTNPYKNLILPEIWARLRSLSLKKICVTSDNLTQDVVMDLLEACPNLEHVVISKKLLTERIANQLVSGSDKEIVKFQAFDDPKTGVQAHRPIRIRNLLRDKHDKELFSDSMLRKIKENAIKAGFGGNPHGSS